MLEIPGTRQGYVDFYTLNLRLLGAFFSRMLLAQVYLWAANLKTSPVTPPGQRGKDLKILTLEGFPRICR